MANSGVGTLVAVGAAGVGGYLVWRLVRGTGGRRPLPCPDRAFKYGDIDNDGWITKNDADLLAQHITGKIVLEAWQLARSDVDGDRTLTVGDVVTILQYLEGIIDTFPICVLTAPTAEVYA